jgi:transposase
MVSYSKAAMERAMKVQEVILRAIAKRITWWQAAEIIGISDRHMRRWRERYEEFGYDGLFDRRRGKPSPKRVPMALVEQILGLYRERYFDLNVRHFHEKLRAEHQIELSYTWVKLAFSSSAIHDAFQPVFSRNAKTILCCSVESMMTRSSRCDSPAQRQRHNANLPSGLANQKLEHPMRRLVAAGFLCA